MKIYLDVNAWMRPFQINSEKTKNEADAVANIVTNSSGKYEIITSEFEINFLYGTQHSRSLDEKKKEAFAKALAFCESVTNNDEEDPSCSDDVKKLHETLKLNDREDRWHIIVAWRKQVDYFITADRELYDTRKKDIEGFLESLWHITAPNNTHSMKILNPIPFASSL